MTQFELIRRVVENKNETYPVPKLPPANPDDYYIVDSKESLEAVIAEMEAKELLDGSDTSMAAQLDDAGYGSAGPM